MMKNYLSAMILLAFLAGGTLVELQAMKDTTASDKKSSIEAPKSADETADEDKDSDDETKDGDSDEKDDDKE